MTRRLERYRMERKAEAGKSGPLLKSEPVKRKGGALFVQIDQTHPDGIPHQAGDIVNVQMVHQLAPVGFDRFNTEMKNFGDFLCRVLFGDQL